MENCLGLNAGEMLSEGARLVEPGDWDDGFNINTQTWDAVPITSAALAAARTGKRKTGYDPIQGILAGATIGAALWCVIAAIVWIVFEILRHLPMMTTGP